MALINIFRYLIPTLLYFSLSSIPGYAQSGDSVIAVFGYPRGYERNTQKPLNKNEMPNFYKPRPQLTTKLFNNSKGHDVYRLKGGMICITPDSTIRQKLIIIKPKRRN